MPGTATETGEEPGEERETLGRRSNETFEKRQREKQKAERKAAKRQRREEAKEADDGGLDGRDEMALMERFRVLSERHDAGQITDASYQMQRAEIFEALGIDD